MIDQHLAELQLLNSAVVINREPRNGRNGNSSPSAELSSMPRANGHSSAAAFTLEKAKMEKEKVDKEKMERKKKHGDRRRVSSDVEQMNKVKHRRLPSDIDSLSPEVRQALQSTFGSKLNEIRSRIRPRAPSPPPRAPSPPPSPSPPPLQESTPVPTPPPSPARSPATALYTEKRTFIERLGDREGAYMLIAYFSAILLSGFILLAAEQDDGVKEDQEEICGGLGFVENRCERLLGHILPLVLAAIFFTFSLIAFVFDVSYSVFNIMMAIRDFFSEKKKKHMSALVSKEDNDDLVTGRPRLSAAGLTLLFVIDLGFVVVSSALLWMSKSSTGDPLRTICARRRQLLWMLGLFFMDMMILFSAIKSFREPQTSNVSLKAAAKRVFPVLCVFLAFTAAYNYAVPESEEVRICATRIVKEIQVYEPLEQCGPVGEGPESLQCQWCPPRRKAARHLDWCEANQQCDWPLAKQIQVYGRKDVCSIGFPQCDWPLLKQIQPYEDKHRCILQEFVQCEWPWVKQIQVYEHEERCKAKDFSLQRCDWPWLKQIQLFEPQDRCPLKNPYECEWPLVKQIQLYESEDFSCLTGCANGADKATSL